MSPLYPRSPLSASDHGTDCGCWDYRQAKAQVERLRASQEELLSAIGAACPVHLVADGPIRLVEDDWRRIEAAAIRTRQALDEGGS